MGTLALLSSLGGNACNDFDGSIARVRGDATTTRTSTLLRELKPHEPAPGAKREENPRASEAVVRYMALRVQPEDAELEFILNAPLSRLRVRISTLSGNLMVNPEELGEMTGVLTADLASLEVFHSVRPHEAVRFPDDSHNALPKQQVLQWLGLDEEVPAARRDANRRVEFQPLTVEVIGPRTLGALAQPGTSTSLYVRGNLTTRGVTTPVDVEWVLSADITAGQLNGLHLKAAKPAAVDLAVFAHQSREGFRTRPAKPLAAFVPSDVKDVSVSLSCVGRPHVR